MTPNKPNNKEYKLGNKDFVDGVCFVLEEMALLGHYYKDRMEGLLEESALLSYKTEILDNIKRNNPDIYRDYFTQNN